MRQRIIRDDKVVCKVGEYNNLEKELETQKSVSSYLAKSGWMCIEDYNRLKKELLVARITAEIAIRSLPSSVSSFTLCATKRELCRKGKDSSLAKIYRQMYSRWAGKVYRHFFLKDVHFCLFLCLRCVLESELTKQHEWRMIMYMVVNQFTTGAVAC